MEIKLQFGIISNLFGGINDYFKRSLFAIMCIFFLIRYMKEKKFYDLLLIPICIYAGAVKTPLVEYLNFNTTFKITYDIAAIILVILAVLFFLKDKKENLLHNKRPFIYLKGLFLYLTLPLHIISLPHAQFVSHQSVQIVAARYQFYLATYVEAPNFVSQSIMCF